MLCGKYLHAAACHLHDSTAKHSQFLQRIVLCGKYLHAAACQAATYMTRQQSTDRLSVSTADCTLW